MKGMIYMARTMTVEQAYTMVNAVYKQVTGESAIDVVDTSSFTVVAGKLSQLHYSQVLPALLEVATGLEIAERPYSAPLKMIWHDESEYISRVLKISYLDNANAEENPAWKIKDGDQLGVHTVKLPRVYQAEIWGNGTIMAHVTITRKQLKIALGSPENLARFYSGLMQNIENQLEQQKESMCRATLLSAINGTYWYRDIADTTVQYMRGSVVHLLTEFKAKYGGEFQNLEAIRKDPAAYTRFIKYCYARMNTIAKQMANRDKYFHINPTKDPKLTDVPEDERFIMRHTPTDRLRVFESWPLLEEISTDVLSGVWNTEYLKNVPHEDVLYWQSPEDPLSVHVKSKAMQPDGSLVDATPDKITNVFAYMFDVDMMGVGVVDQDEGDTQFDQERKALNRIWDMDIKSWVDFTEKAVLLLMD